MPTLMLMAVVVCLVILFAGIILASLGLIPSVLVKLAGGLAGAAAGVIGVLSRKPVQDWLRSEWRRADPRPVGLSAVVAVIVLIGGVVVLGINRPALTPGSSIADWSKWGATGQWHVEHSTHTINGMTVKETLVSDGSAPCCDPSVIGLVAPGEAPSGDYAIEAHIQVFGSNPIATAGLVYMGILAQGDQSGDGYLYGILDNSPSPHPGAAFFSDLSSGGGPQSLQPYPLDTTVHVYRVEVQGFTTRFLIDGKLILQTRTSAYSQDRRYGLIDSGYQMKVLMLSVTPLDG